MPIDEQILGDGLLAWNLSNPRRRNAVAPDDLAFIARRAPALGDQVVVLRGAGGGPFCSGFDLAHLDADERPDRPLMRATAAMERSPALFIAQVAGYAIGAGVELCAACDFVCADEAAFFAIPAGKLGVLYHRAGLARLARRFSRRALRSMILLGRREPARTLAAEGALDHLAPSGALDDDVRTMAEALLAVPAAVRRHTAAWLRGDDGEATAPDAWADLRGRLYAARRRGAPATLPGP